MTPPGPLGRIALGTTNRHKAREIAAILAPFRIEVEVPSGLPPVVEDGATFAQNAYLKAASAARALDRPALADDSGIVVDALGGEPGVQSARYAGDDATDEQNTARLLREIAARGLVDPVARFVCHAVLVAPTGEVLARAEGCVEGVVRGPPRGANGFGYDPVFHVTGPGAPPPGLRMAEMSPTSKDAMSHRGRAFREIAARIAALFQGAADGPRPTPLGG